VLTLLTRLRYAAEDHVIDSGRIEIRARHDRVETHCAEIHRVDACQPALATPACQAHGVDDECFSHMFRVS